MEEIAYMLFRAGAINVCSDISSYYDCKKSPIYLDVRCVLGNVQARNIVADALATKIFTQYPNCEVLAGICSGGIGFAAIAAHLMGLPMCYVRNTAKPYGLERTIEGATVEKKRVVIVDDLICMGSASLHASKRLQEMNATVLGACCVFSYNTTVADKRLAREKMTSGFLVGLNEIITVGISVGYFDKKTAHYLTQYQQKLTLGHDSQ